MSKRHSPECSEDVGCVCELKREAEKCQDCGQPKHEYWWDCPGPPRAPWELKRKKRTHSFIIK